MPSEAAKPRPSLIRQRSEADQGRWRRVQSVWSAFRVGSTLQRKMNPMTPLPTYPDSSSDLALATTELEQISKGDVTGMRPSSREAGAHVWRADVVTRMYEISWSRTSWSSLFLQLLSRNATISHHDGVCRRVRRTS